VVIEDPSGALTPQCQFCITFTRWLRCGRSVYTPIILRAHYSQHSHIPLCMTPPWMACRSAKKFKPQQILASQRPREHKRIGICFLSLSSDQAHRNVEGRSYSWVWAIGKLLPRWRERTNTSAYRPDINVDADPTLFPAKRLVQDYDFHTCENCISHPSRVPPSKLSHLLLQFTALHGVTPVCSGRTC